MFNPITISNWDKNSKLLRGDTSGGLTTALFPFPHPDSTRKYYDKFIEENITVERANIIRKKVALKMIEKYSKNADKTLLDNFGLACDGVDIAKSLTIIGNTVLGLDNNRDITYLLNTPVQKIMDSVATHMQQFFLISLDGNIVIPIHAFPYRSITYNSLVAMIKKIKEDFKDKIKISWLSLDGDLPDIEGKLPDNMLIFRDTDHVCKNGRNAILHKTIQWKDIDNDVKVSLTDLQKLEDNHIAGVDSNVTSALKKLLKFKSCGISSYDKLRLDPVKRLVHRDVINFLDVNFKKNETDIEKKMLSLSRYLKLLNAVLYLWDWKDNEKSAAYHNSTEERINHLKIELCKLQLNSRSHFTVQCQSLVRNYYSIKELNIPGMKYSLLVTRMVENFFSTVRNFVQHPNVEEYLRSTFKAGIIFAKEHSDLIFFPLKPKEEIIGSYNKISGVNISWKEFMDSMKSAEYSSVRKTRDKRKKIQTTMDQLSTFDKEYILSLQLLVNAERRTKSLSTTKYTPDANESTNSISFLSKNSHFFCKFCSIPFKYYNAMSSHILQKHNDIQDKLKFEDFVTAYPSKICNINLFPIHENKFGNKYLPHQHPIEADKNNPISDIIPPDSFDEVKKKMIKKIENREHTLPLLFNTNFNKPNLQEKENCIIFADCETEGSTTGIPISFFMYCLNDSKSIYVKMKPKNNMSYFNENFLKEN